MICSGIGNLALRMPVVGAGDLFWPGWPGKKRGPTRGRRSPRACVMVSNLSMACSGGGGGRQRCGFFFGVFPAASLGGHGRAGSGWYSRPGRTASTWSAARAEVQPPTTGRRRCPAAYTGPQVRGPPAPGRARAAAECRKARAGRTLVHPGAPASRATGPSRTPTGGSGLSHAPHGAGSGLMHREIVHRPGRAEVAGQARRARPGPGWR